MPSVLALLGSSRRRGGARQMLDFVLGDRPVEVVDLSDLDIGFYDYDHRNADDDFLPLAERLVRFDAIVLATPVYWYSMSAQMKVFVDRLSDLITIRKDLGRALAGRRLYVVTASEDEELPSGFEVPFELTCGYFDMIWGGLVHGYFEDDILHPDSARAARDFGRSIFGGVG